MWSRWKSAYTKPPLPHSDRDTCAAAKLRQNTDWTVKYVAFSVHLRWLRSCTKPRQIEHTSSGDTSPSVMASVKSIIVFAHEEGTGSAAPIMVFSDANFDKTWEVQAQGYYAVV